MYQRFFSPVGPQEPGLYLGDFSADFTISTSELDFRQAPSLSCALSFRLSSSNRSNSPMDWEREVNLASPSFSPLDHFWRE